MRGRLRVLVAPIQEIPAGADSTESTSTPSLPIKKNLERKPREKTEAVIDFVEASNRDQIDLANGHTIRFDDHFKADRLRETIDLGAAYCPFHALSSHAWSGAGIEGMSFTTELQSPGILQEL